MILLAALLVFAIALLVWAFFEIHRARRAAQFWFRLRQVLVIDPAAKYACPMTAEEIAAMHATRWDGD